MYGEFDPVLNEVSPQGGEFDIKSPVRSIVRPGKVDSLFPISARLY